jgi:hypothetical protein
MKAADKNGQDGHLEDGKGNLAMINTGVSADIAAGAAIGGTELRGAWINCLISLLTSTGFALLRFPPRAAM